MDTAPLLRRLSQSKEHQAHVAARHLPLIEMNRPTVQGTSGPWGSRTAPSRAEATGAAALQLSAPEEDAEALYDGTCLLMPHFVWGFIPLGSSHWLARRGAMVW
eukprot:CAMPEP_0181202910 /NCGR_PEP_ID=MMETSP1096-20121128/19102_1 /TAXON_ID=156174 ORGANISM="Chrysochromulina ericina, Strain CCMP281" /NCGR_SAMPLE_ID=MMETSP1096 /ASSEMBLY_ACC=CAM_ASM_000453 /LENGTH=103 /DNA_ID=CAMNT_0023293471 /DNA_START=298 /DNA_END=607 /DNA_ORIENTATION=+